MGIWGSVPHSGAHRAWVFSLISTCGRGGFVEKMCVTRRELYGVRLSKIFLDNLVSVQECSRWENVKCCTITRPGVNISARGFKLSQNAIYLPCMSIENISNKLQKKTSRHAGRKNYSIRRWAICHWSLLKNKLPNVTPMCFCTHSINLFHT